MTKKILLVVLLSLCSTAAVAQGLCCAVPSEESITPNGNTLTTLSKFYQVISDSHNTSFAGRTVTESPTSPGSNSCYWSGNSVGLTQSPVVTGGSWSVVSGNGWGDDTIGMFKAAVDSVRTEGLRSGVSLPCVVRLYQTMSIYCSSYPWVYTEDILKFTINSGTIENCRAATCTTILY